MLSLSNGLSLHIQPSPLSQTTIMDTAGKICATIHRPLEQVSILVIFENVAYGH